MPAGYGNLMLSCLVLEIGSAAFNLVTIYPGRLDVWYFYHIVHTASNLVGALLGYLLFSYTALSMNMKLFYVGFGYLVIIGRQLNAYHLLRDGFNSTAKKQSSSANKNK